MKLTVQDFRPVAYWLWDVRDADDVCGICQHLFDDVCGGACKAAGDACPLLVGRCTHVFHMHCIMRWLASQRSRGSEQAPARAEDLCPMCKRPWQEMAHEPEGAAATAEATT